MYSKIIPLSIMAAAAVGLLLFVSGPIVVNQQAFAYHGGSNLGYNFGYNLGYHGGPCGGGPFTTVAGLVTCTLDAP